MLRERETNPPRPAWQMRLLGWFGITGQYLPRNSFWASVWYEIQDNFRPWWLNTPWVRYRQRRETEELLDEIEELAERRRLKRKEDWKKRLE